MKHLILITALTAVLTAFSGCNLTQAPIDEMETSSHESDEMMEDKRMEEMEEMMPELTSKELTKYQANLPLEERVMLAEEISMMMPHNGMDAIRTMFPDLEKTTDIENDDPRNMMKAGLENWHYSTEGDFTISVCDEANSPIHVFKGQNPTQPEIDEAIEMMEEMMQEMMEERSNEMMEGGQSDTISEEPQFIAYDEAIYNSLLGGKPFAIFFHADWCPTCRTMEKDINAELSSFPNGTMILQADYDTEKALKSTYNVLFQSTIVVVDKDGKAVKTLAAPSTDEIISAISETL